MKDDTVWVDRDATGLDEVEASAGDASHEGLQGDPSVVAIDGDFVSQSRVSSPDDPHVKVSPAIGVQRSRAVGLVARNADVIEGFRKADTGPVGTLGFELQGHKATEAVEEWGRGTGSVEGRGATEAARSPAGRGVATGVSRILVVVVFVHIRRQRIAAHVSWGLVHLVGVQTNRLHWSGVVGIDTVAEGLPTTAKAAAERAVAVGVVHHWSLVVHIILRGGVVRVVNGDEEVGKKGMEGI